MDFLSFGFHEVMFFKTERLLGNPSILPEKKSYAPRIFSLGPILEA
jgi:hypothetical protein